MIVLLEWNCFHSKWKNWHSKAHSQKATRKREKKTHCRWVTLLNLTPSPLSDSPNSVFNSFLMLTHLDFLHLFTTHNVLTISYLTNWFRACWGTLASLRTTTCPAAPRQHHHEGMRVHLIRILCQAVRYTMSTEIMCNRHVPVSHQMVVR